jgi:hypothetical protein
MRAVGYDALAVGNHELDFGVEALEALLARVDLPAVCASVSDPATGRRVPGRAVAHRGARRRAHRPGRPADAGHARHQPSIGARLSFADPAQASQPRRRSSRAGPTSSSR